MSQNPNPSLLDQQQILQRVFDKDNDTLRTDAFIQVDTINADLTVNIDAATGDNISFANADGSKKVTITTFGSNEAFDSNIVHSVLPDGGATSVKQDVGNTSLNNIDNKLNSLGQKNSSESVPVVIATNQSHFPIELQDGSGNNITSQINGSQRALDIGINVAGTQVDPRQIRSLTSSDIITSNQGSANIVSNGWPVKPTDGTNSQSYTVLGEAKVQITELLTEDHNNGTTGSQTLRVAANLAIGGNNVSTTNTVPVDIITPITISNKLKYEDMNVSTGGIARGTNIIGGAGWSSIYSYTGSGFLLGAKSTFTNLTGTAVNHWNIRLVTDGNEIFGSVGLNGFDLCNSSLYNWNTGTTSSPIWGGIDIIQNTFSWQAPNDYPLKFTTSITIYISRTGAVNNTWLAGVVCILKD